MEKTETRTIISGDNYKEIITMLTSNDESSVTMGLTIMEQADFEKSQVYILCLLKESFEKVFKSNTNKFEESYPVLHSKIVDVLTDKDVSLATLSFKKIFELTLTSKSESDMLFLMDIFKDELVRLLTDYGFTFLEYLDIKVTPKKV